MLARGNLQTGPSNMYWWSQLGWMGDTRNVGQLSWRVTGSFSWWWSCSTSPQAWTLQWPGMSNCDMHQIKFPILKMFSVLNNNNNSSAAYYIRWFLYLLHLLCTSYNWNGLACCYDLYLEVIGRTRFTELCRCVRCRWGNTCIHKASLAVLATHMHQQVSISRLRQWWSVSARYSTHYHNP